MAATSGLMAPLVTMLFMFALRPVAVETGLTGMPVAGRRRGAPVPLIGGTAMVMGLGIGVVLTNQPEFLYPAMLGIYLLMAVGMIDDRYDLPVSVRFVAQITAALLVVTGSNVLVASLGAALYFEMSLGILAIPFTILLILTLINGYNIIDGIDGLAGGAAFLALAALAFIGLGTEVFMLTMLLLAVLASFLLFNLPLKFNRRVRAYMGDAGSTSLGLAIAFVGIILCQGAEAVMAPVVGLWLVSLPAFEVFWSIVRRIKQGQSPFEGDRGHLHHLLMEHGLSPATTLALLLSLAALFAGVGLAGHVAGIPDAVMLLGWLAAGASFRWMMRCPDRVVALVQRGATATRDDSASGW